jgi:thiol-disulfide isomerase/thioredoxin
MLTLNLGPLALPVNPLLMMAGWWLAAAVADRLCAERSPRTRQVAARALMMSALVGLLASRAGFAALAWDAHMAEPQPLWSLLNLRDGGWMPEAGWAAALGVLGGFAWRHPGTRRALALGALAGSALWGVASTALGIHQTPALPALTLQTLEGQPLRLAPDNRPMVINLWASWCGPCREEMPAFARAEAGFPGVRFVFVNHGEKAEVARRWLQQQAFQLKEVALDPQQELAGAMRTSGLPTTLFVDAQGQVLERHFGPLSVPSLVGRLRSLPQP